MISKTMIEELEDASIQESFDKYEPVDSRISAWNEVWDLIKALDPHFCGGPEDRRTGLQCVLDAIQNFADKEPNKLVKRGILDRDATWKILHTPLSNVISYLQSMPKTAEIVEDYNGNSDNMELIVVQH